MIIAETSRLIIRNFKIGDWEALCEMIKQYGSSEVAAYDQQWPTSPDEIRKITEWFASGNSYFAVCLKDTDRFIGFVSLNQEEGDCRDFNIGYIFNFDYHHQGYATEACRAVIDHAFRGLQAQTVLTGTAAANLASCKLLERLGFKKTSEITSSFQQTPDGKPIDFLGYIYSLSRNEWEAIGKGGIVK